MGPQDRAAAVHPPTAHGGRALKRSSSSADGPRWPSRRATKKRKAVKKVCKKVKIKGTRRTKTVCRPKKKVVKKKKVVAAPVAAAAGVRRHAAAGHRRPGPSRSRARPPRRSRRRLAPPPRHRSAARTRARPARLRRRVRRRPGRAPALARRLRPPARPGRGARRRSACAAPSQAHAAERRPATLTGARPTGNPIAPHNAWGHDHLWWLDRMVRSDQQLVERMTLIWHDWFATTNDDVGDQHADARPERAFRAARSARSRPASPTSPPTRRCSSSSTGSTTAAGGPTRTTPAS